MKSSFRPVLAASLGLLLVPFFAGCAGTDADLHQHRQIAKEKPMAEREIGKGTFVTDRLGRTHYVWPEDSQETSP